MIELYHFESVIKPLRKDFLKIAEQMREQKIIGKSEELGVRILWGGEDKYAAIWSGEFLQTMLKSSWVVMDWEESPGELSWKLHIWDLKKDPDFKQCSRCFLYHIQKDNYDNLCDRCLRVMLQFYPSHPTMDAYFEARPHLSHTRYIKL